MELIFAGQNRKASLDKLVSRYKYVESAAKENTESVSSAGHIVLISADPGLGKTRIAQELYGYISTESSNTSNYWPQTLESKEQKIALMPTRESCRYDEAIPFIWWGITLSNSNDDNAVRRSLGSVLPHVTALRLSQMRDPREETILRLLAETTSDFLIGSIDELSGISHLKRLWQFGRDLKSAIGEQRPGQSSLSATKEKESSVIDTLLLQMEELFSPQSPHYAHIPAVVIVDDAHFSYEDPTSTIFVEQLIDRIKVQGWPILMLVMHWEKESKDRQGFDGEYIPMSPIAAVLKKATVRSNVNLDDCGTEGSDGSIPCWYSEINLSEPIDNLQIAIMERYPSFPTEHVMQISSKAAGNPRKLEQVLRKMDRKPIWFEDPLEQAILSKTGLDAVLALTELDVIDIALERLCETPEHIRKSLTLASLLGFTFVIPLIEKITFSNNDLKRAFQEAETIYGFVRDYSSRNEIGVSQFSEYLFYEATCRYRTDGFVNRDFSAWPGDDHIQSEIRKYLATLIDSEESRLELENNELAYCYNLAHRVFDRVGGVHAPQALAHLTNIEVIRGNYENALYVANNFLNYLKEQQWEVGDIGLSRSSDVADILFNLGELDSAESIWLSIVGYIEATSILISEQRKELAYAFSRLGYVHKERSEFELAKSMHESSLEIYTAIENSIGVASQYGDIGIVYEATGDYESAEVMFRKALSLYQKEGFDEGTAAAFGNLANMCERRNDLDKALEYHQQSLELHIKCENKHSEGIEYLNIARVLLLQEQLDEAESMYMKAYSLQSKLHNKSGIASCCGGLGDLYHAKNNLDLSIDYYQKSIDLFLELGNKLNSAESYCNLGTIYEAKGDYTKAQSQYEKSLIVFEQLGNKEKMAIGYACLGFLYRDTRNILGAFDMLNKALIIYREIKLNYEVAELSCELGLLYQEKGELDTAMNMFKESLSAYAEEQDQDGVGTQ